MSTPMNLYRTLLFAPCSRPELMLKAQEGQADALIFDLEYFVPLQSKAQARENLRQVLELGPKKPFFLRLNHPQAGDSLADLAALGERNMAALAGVILPKAERTGDIEQLSVWLEDLERRWGTQAGRLRVLPLVETCLGLRHTYDLASCSPRVCGVSLASAEQGDFMVDLGGHWTPSSAALMYPRSQMVVDARAAGLSWLVDGVFMNLSDAQALEVECRLARELGFVAKMAIHPSQVEVMQRVFTPSQAEIDHARGLLAAFREAEAQGIGAVRYQGLMVDYANVRLAERTLALAQGSQP